MTNLKPCPFCGGKATLLMRTYTLPSETYVVYCEDCDAQGQPRSTEAEAIEVWNRRKTPRESRAKLPCPKCGKKRLSVWCSADAKGNPIESIACDKCKIASAWSRTTIGAIRDWNKMVREWRAYDE